MFSPSFEQEEISFNNQKRVKALLATVLFSVLVLLAFYLIRLTIPDPPFLELAEGGVEINFGFDAAGEGDVQAFSDNQGPMSSTPVKGAAAAASSQADETLTQEDEETDAVVQKPSVAPKPKTNNTPKPVITPTKNNTTNITTVKTNATSEPVQKADPDALFPTRGAKGTPNDSKGDGIGGGKGDQGDPNGDPNSKSYLGGGSGNGEGNGNGNSKGGFSLKNRKNVALPSPVACSGRGKVVIGIKVDRTGKVIETTFRRFDSTVFDECNKNNALNAARNARFNPDPNAEEIQEGTITYINEVK